MSHHRYNVVDCTQTWAPFDWQFSKYLAAVAQMCASELEAWHSKKRVWISLQLLILFPESIASATGLLSDHLLVLLSLLRVTTEAATIEGVSSATEEFMMGIVSKNLIDCYVRRLF
mmetsp:Transcript_10957/g.16139  ORF Transcript_10957/g.16139 Transcript_10957/m.16139 type:complete len:116 (+) Transcript_10957:197-544(+)